MNTTKHDKINQELSRIYFNSKNTGTTPDKNDTAVKKKPLPVNRVILLLAVISFISLSALSAVMIKYIFTSAATKDKTPPEGTPAAAPEENTAAVTGTKENEPYPTMVEPLAPDSDTYILFDFETDEEGWGIPAWALNMRDHVATSLEKSSKVSSSGDSSLRINADFPKDQWSAAVVEIQNFLNLKNFDVISVDVYFPPNRSKTALRGKMILTVGDKWEFAEMSRTFRITPGEWTTISANLSPRSIDWKNEKITDDHFKSDIRKIAVRIESTKTRYHGPVYIDNLRVSKLPEKE